MSTGHWQDDLMNRDKSGNFLYNLVQGKYEAFVKADKSASLTFSLDGGWGTGKSFFIERWSQDIENKDHAVIRFDAWKNDLSDDPLVGFISEINTTLKPLIGKIPHLSPQGKAKLTKQIKKFSTNAGKALLPALGHIGKGLATRYLSKEGVDALKQIVSSEDTNESNTKNDNKIASQALEKYFDDVLKSHSSQKAAISNLIADLERLAEYLEETNKIRLPIYVFIDELDRCRPSYAIRLLEGIKHLFNAQGVCFVISTNMTQLAHSVKAVYGPGFDGHNYLKRFFDFEYKLPAPNNLAHSKYLYKNSNFITRTKVETAIQSMNEGTQIVTIPNDELFAEIAYAFNLDLRSQKQVFAQAEGAATAIDKNETVHLVYLYALAALAHTDPQAIDNILNKDAPFPIETLSKRPYKTFFYDSNGRRQEKIYTIADIISFYSVTSKKTIKRITVDIRDINQEELPTSLLSNIIAESNVNRNSILFKYPGLIRLAGDISAITAP